MENYHSHSEFCDGRAPISEMAEAAFKAGFHRWGISPHGPICCLSSCNMKKEDVDPYIAEVDRMKKLYMGRMEVLAGMEVDYISDCFGPHLDYFRNLPLDYRIGSVHFVRAQDGHPVDVDGPAERFLEYLAKDFSGDLEYTVKTFFAMELEMISHGGFDILGHLDKLADNASHADPNIEDYPWYGKLVEEVIAKAVEKGVKIEINTKKFDTTGRFFPSERWWSLLRKYGAEIVISTDAHYPDKVSAGYEEARNRLRRYGLM